VNLEIKDRQGLSTLVIGDHIQVLYVVKVLLESIDRALFEAGFWFSERRTIRYYFLYGTLLDLERDLK